MGKEVAVLVKCSISFKYHLSRAKKQILKAGVDIHKHSDNIMSFLTLKGRVLSVSNDPVLGIPLLS